MTFQWSRRTFRRRRRRRIVERCSKHVRLFQSAFGISRERALPIQIERDETNSFLLSLLLFVWSGPPPKNAPRALGSLVRLPTHSHARIGGCGERRANDGRTEDTRGRRRRRDYYYFFF